MTKKKSAPKGESQGQRRWAWWVAGAVVLAGAGLALAKSLSQPQPTQAVAKPVEAPAPTPTPQTQVAVPEPAPPPPLVSAPDERPQFSGYCSRSFDAAFAVPVGRGCEEGLTASETASLSGHACFGLRASVGAAPGPGNCWTVTVTEHALLTALMCKMCGTATSCEMPDREGVTMSDLEHPVVRFVPSGTPPPTRGASFTLDCV